MAFNNFGSGNTVKRAQVRWRSRGRSCKPVQTVTKVGPGFNINGLKGRRGGGGPQAKTAAPTATAVRTGKKTAAPAA